MDGANHIEAGKWGEKQAERFLRKKGFRILGRRVQLDRRNEIDLVVRSKDTLVFVEVKTRKTTSFGRPIAAVDRRKREVLSRAAVRYLSRLKDRHIYFRFDVVEVIGSREDGHPEICHTENVFPLDLRYSLPA